MSFNYYFKHRFLFKDGVTKGKVSLFVHKRSEPSIKIKESESVIFVGILEMTIFEGI